MYQNGQRLSYTFDSFIPSFNGVESIDVVKGPGSPVIGPSNLGVGGYVNFVTKAPYFDRWHGALTFTLGNLVEGGSSYLRPEWQLDFGGPLIKDKLAIRVSYLGREADTYYQNVKDQTQDLFAAVTFIPIPALTFDYTAQFYEERFNENEGFNRAYQDFTNETFVPYDLSQGPNFTVLPTNVIFGGRLIPGSGGYTATPSASVESRLNDFGFFAEDNIDFTKWLTVYLGGRFDYIGAKSHRPELGTFLDGTGGTLDATPYRSRNTFNPSYFGSIVLKPTSWLTAAGVEAGGRTGLTSLIVAVCFLLALPLHPIISIIPAVATAPALMMVGVLMMQSITSLNLRDLSIAVPAIVTIVIMAVGNISDGMALGMIIHVLIMVLSGRTKEVHLLTYVLALMFGAHFFFK